MKTKQKYLGSGFVLLTAGILAGCGSNEGSPAAENEEGHSQLNVGILEIVADAPLVLGEEEGIFEEHGIDLNLQSFNAGSAMVPAALEGSIDLGSGNTLSVMIAQERGMDLQMISSNAVMPSEDEDISSISVSADSDFESIEDLRGHTIAVNAFSSITDVAVKGLLEDAGIEEDEVDLIELPFPQMPQAITDGNIDAAIILSPFPQLEADNLRTIAYPYSYLYPDESLAGFYASDEWVDNNSELSDRFAAAYQEAAEYTNENQDEARAELVDFLDLPPEVVEDMPLPVFTGELTETPASVQGAIDAGILSEEPDYTELYRN